MTPQEIQKLKEFHNKLTDRPIEPDDPFYVSFHAEQQSDGDPIAAIATRIAFEEGESVSLLSGQRGSGKSTELRRLRKMLREQGCVVLLSDMREYMNMTTPVNITDFLLSLMGGLSEAAADEVGGDLTKEGLWTRILSFLKTDVQLDEVKYELGVGPGKIGFKGALRDDPTFKKRLQDALRGHASRIVDEAQRFATDVVTKIRKARSVPGAKVVLLVDSLEQITGVGAEADEVHRSVQNLFAGFAHALQLPLLHVVYTLPPYMAALHPLIGATLGGAMVESLPSVHVRTREGAPDPKGLGVMRMIVERRFPGWASVFSNAQVERLAQASGGDLRDFFRMLRDCLTRAAGSGRTLPMDDAFPTAAQEHLAREMALISKEDLKWLAAIARTKKPELDSVERLPQLARLFDTHVVLNYRNGKSWYDVHPLLLEELAGAGV